MFHVAVLWRRVLLCNILEVPVRFSVLILNSIARCNEKWFCITCALSPCRNWNCLLFFELLMIYWWRYFYLDHVISSPRSFTSSSSTEVCNFFNDQVLRQKLVIDNSVDQSNINQSFRRTGSSSEVRTVINLHHNAEEKYCYRLIYQRREETPVAVLRRTVYKDVRL